MIELAIAAVALVAVVAAWDAARRALLTRLEVERARADAALSERVQQLEERVVALERSARETAIMAAGRTRR